MRAIVALASLSFLFALGCGSSTGSPSIPLDRYCDAVAHTVCDRFVPCCDAGGMTLSSGDCLQSQTARCNALVATQQSKGRVYDAQSAGACVGGSDLVFDGCVTRSLDFWATGRLAESCVRVWTGTAKPGEACTEDADCAARSEGDVSCADDGKGGHACVVERRVSVGERCDLSAGGSLVGCASGSYCAPSSDGTSTCVAAAREGEACSSSFPGSCADGLACDYRSNTCRAPGVVGDDCFGSVPCAQGLYCNAYRGKCAAPLTKGGACADYERCADGLACVSGVCADLLDDGQSCTWAGQCKSSYCALEPPSYASGTCKANGAASYHFPEGFDASICSDLTHP